MYPSIVECGWKRVANHPFGNRLYQHIPTIIYGEIGDGLWSSFTTINQDTIWQAAQCHPNHTYGCWWLESHRWKNDVSQWGWWILLNALLKCMRIWCKNRQFQHVSTSPLLNGKLNEPQFDGWEIDLHFLEGVLWFSPQKTPCKGDFPSHVWGHRIFF